MENLQEQVFAYREKVRPLRYIGKLLLAIEPLSDTPQPSDVIANADTFIVQQRLHAIGSGWIVVEEKDAFTILTFTLEKDLAYHFGMMEPETARALAAEFLGFFEPDCTYLTNGTYHMATQKPNGRVTRGHSWTPLTDATFDTGVVVMDSHKIGFLWVLDED